MYSPKSLTLIAFTLSTLLASTTSSPLSSNLERRQTPNGYSCPYPDQATQEWLSSLPSGVNDMYSACHGVYGYDCDPTTGAVTHNSAALTSDQCSVCSCAAPAAAAVAPAPAGASGPSGASGSSAFAKALSCWEENGANCVGTE